jgi:hypothetical protein
MVWGGSGPVQLWAHQAERNYKESSLLFVIGHHPAHPRIISLALWTTGIIDAVAFWELHKWREQSDCDFLAQSENRN